MSLPSADEIAQIVEDEIRRRANVSQDDAEFTRDINVFEYGYLDSFGAVELVEFVEKAFDVKVSDEDLATKPLNTVNEIAAYVAMRLGG